MTIQVSNTLSHPASSTASVGCAARALAGEQRHWLAPQVLARSESVTKLAKRHPGLKGA